jgi:hypothetical protein
MGGFDFWIEDPVKGKLYGFGIDRFAVMKFYSFPQGDLPG